MKTRLVAGLALGEGVGHCFGLGGSGKRLKRAADADDKVYHIRPFQALPNAVVCKKSQSDIVTEVVDQIHDVRSLSPMPMAGNRQLVLRIEYRTKQYMNRMLP